MMDVAIIGGGPAGSTTGAIIKKYRPDLSVTILEREKFPRDHVGESQLPPIGDILHEMGCWDKVEAANFPIKIGGTYRWGQTDELWDFEFLPLNQVQNEPRPGKFEGWRTRTALQVDRSVYDQILLDHAESLGCEVRQETKVVEAMRTGDRVEGLRLDDGAVINAKYYVDATGSAGLLRRTMGVECEVPKTLKNIAIWDYWENADWAVEIGVGGTRIQIMSLPYGWIWFIPLSPTRTSVGLVVPAEYYKSNGQTPEALYTRALAEEPRIAELMVCARSEGNVRTTKDWSFVSERTAGENWFLVGESAGFADPILSAGMTIAQLGARELAYIIIALDSKVLDGDWLRFVYDEAQRSRVWQHIRFANFWYTGNGRFTDLWEYTREIARDAGYDMDANQAFRWFASGSFTHDSPTATLAHHGMVTAKYIAQQMMRQRVDWEIAKNNTYRLNLARAEPQVAAEFRDGEIRQIRCYRRAGKVLRLSNLNEILIKAVEAQPDITLMFELLQVHFRRYSSSAPEFQERMFRAVEAMEALILEGWIDGSVTEGRPFLPMVTPTEPGPFIHPNNDPPVRVRETAVA